MVDAVVSFAIEKLGDYVIEQVSTRLGVKDGVDWLRSELGFLLNSAKEAEPIITVEVVRLWINNVNDAAYDAKAILDKFFKIQQEQSSQDCLQRCIGKLSKEPKLYDIGTQIDLLKKKVSCVKERRTEQGIDIILAEVRKKDIDKGRQRRLQRGTSIRNKEEMVGFKNDILSLMAKLDGPYLPLGMISIHGMGGLGKTRLASELYHSVDLNKFKSRAWVCVTQDYEIKDLLKMLIKSFIRHRPEHKLDIGDDDDVVDLLHQLKKLLSIDRYLAVIDDVWNIKAWQDIKEAFPDNNNGSRIIITTRDKTIAQNVDTSCFVHQLNFLDKDDSLLLFRSRASSSNKDKLVISKAKPSAQLENLGKEMVGKCQGLPLAIVELTKLLMRDQNYQDWVNIKKDIWRELKDNCMEIKELLSLSYMELSVPAKSCFLYLARFPPDHAVLVDELIRLWVAEEFIPDVGNGVVMEDEAEKCLKELIDHNLIQINTLQMSGQVAQCRVHELVRYLALQKATEEGLLGIFDSSKQDPRPLGHARQAIYNGIGEFFKLHKPSPNDSKLWSLAVINETSLVELNEMKSVCTRFKRLKVLDLISVQSEHIPDGIGDLVYLKFLGLMGGSVKALVIPPTIGKLKDLQTLCGSFSSQYECPKEIRELKELRHLYLENFSASVPSGSLKIGCQQTKLQTLGNIWIKDWIHIDTVNLTSLRKLCIRDASAQDNVYFNLESIAELKNLQTFSLEFRTNVIPTIKPLSSCISLNRVALFGRMNDKSDLSLLPNSITELSLSNSEFKQDPMLVLGSLENLTALYLDKAYTGNKMVCSADSFSSLKFLRLKALTHLEELQVQDGALPFLQGFDVNGCDKLKLIPQLGVPPIPLMYKFWDFL